MGKVEIGELVRIKREVDKSVSFFESETSIGEVIDRVDDLYYVKVLDIVYEVLIEDIIGKVEKLSKSKHMK